MLNNRSIAIGSHVGFARKGAKNYRALTGTIALTNDSAAVVGTGTAFDDDLEVGQTLRVGDYTLTISVITDGTHLTIDAVFAGDTAAGLTAFREAGTLAGPTVKPVTVIPAHWLNFGSVSAATFEPNLKSSTVIAPLAGGGIYQPKTIVPVGFSPMLKLTTNEINELILESLYCGAGPIVNGANFVPGGGTGLIEGWLQIKRYAGNTLELIVEQYGFLSVKTEKADGSGKHIEPEYEFAVMGNALAVGNSTLASI